MHGGLFSKDGVTLDDIRKIDRNRQPPEEGNATHFPVLNFFLILVFLNLCINYF